MQVATSTPAAANESELRTRATPGGQAVALPQAGMSGGQSIEGAFPTAAASTTRRNRGETTAKIHQVIDALMRWNTSQVDAAKQLRISIPTIKGLASALGANYQPAIQAVLQERAAELEAMHSQLMLGTRHNASVPHKDEILRAIAQGELGLEHWQAVRYSG